MANVATLYEHGNESPVDLQLMVSFYPRRADNRTFRPPVTLKQKNIKFQKRLKIVELSHTAAAGRPWSQPQRHAPPLPGPACLELGAGGLLRSYLKIFFLGGGTLRLAAR